LYFPHWLGNIHYIDDDNDDDDDDDDDDYDDDAVIFSFDTLCYLI